jgi:hypothetical protein
MHKNKFGLVFTSTFLLAIFEVLSLFPQASWAIERVSDRLCSARSDYFKLWNNTTSANGVCFANAGTISIKVYNVGKISNGNNYASVRYTTSNNRSIRTYFCDKNVERTYNPRIRVVTSITLSANPPSACFTAFRSKNTYVEVVEEAALEGRNLILIKDADVLEDHLAVKVDRGVSQIPANWGSNRPSGDVRLPRLVGFHGSEGSQSSFGR